MDFDVEKFEKLVVWINKSVRCKFKVEADGVFTTYIDSDGEERMMTAPANDSEQMVHDLKYYIDITRHEWDLPGIEFSDDYKQFKIFKRL